MESSEIWLCSGTVGDTKAMKEEVEGTLWGSGPVKHSELQEIKKRENRTTRRQRAGSNREN